jgi:hypothetical protein
VVSENRSDPASVEDEARSIDRARYWFDQYRYASDCEARLIRAIRELSSKRIDAPRELEWAQGSAEVPAAKDSV